MRSRSLWLCAALLVLAGCSSEPTEPRVLKLPSDSGSSASPGGQGKSIDKDDNAGDKSGKSGGDAGAAEPGAADGNDGAQGSGGDGGEGVDGSVSDRGGGEHDAALFLEPGDYTYAQSGYREYCAGSCEREMLPPESVTRAHVSSGSGRDATVVTEERSDEGVVRITTRYEGRAASVLEVYTRLVYRGFEFERTYRPDPPVLQLVSDLEVGRHWDGSWDGDVSGDYEAAVVSRETVMVGGKVIQTMKVFTVTNYRGELRGRSDIASWVDPQTLAVVKSKGVVNLDSDLGSYSTRFRMTLSKGPGYP
ncbi:MAG: hypothetical protein QOH26_767 [Actinomycetota bacterium]|nr:hypothetical protein [Actinomycetota bacterium]